MIRIGQTDGIKYLLDLGRNRRVRFVIHQERQQVRTVLDGPGVIGHLFQHLLHG